MQQYPPHDPNRAPTRAAIPRHGAPSPPPARRAKPRTGRTRWLFAGVGLVAVLGMSLLAAFGASAFLLYGSGDILPGVQAAGVDVGNLSEAEAAQAIRQAWADEGILLRDGDRIWGAQPAELGLEIDADATAAAAHEWGRGRGGILAPLTALRGNVKIEPRLMVQLPTARDRLEAVRGIVEIEPRNAGVVLVNGDAQATPAEPGRRLDIEATISRLRANAAAELADGALDLVMLPVSPRVTDATPLVAEARAWLNRTIELDIYDPVGDISNTITLDAQTWSTWLIASEAADSAAGLRLQLDESQLRAFLEEQSTALGNARYLDIDESAARINDALRQNAFKAWLRVYHTPTTYTVQGGESISSIGYNLGIPYPWIHAANPGLGALSPGQQINIPSKDDLLPLPVVRDKRIVVSISEQAMWAYENGELLWHWPVSTGIARSPTSPGIFQIQSHEINAYASQWNLYMPHFMGVYEPGPNAGVMNGFHGFPTDANGGYLLWENSLGRPATYGCILLSLDNAEQLYTWAEEGVVVEIQP
ncbi:MAG: L,D-transpeptidase family protein [Anaerolineales bacterium]